MAVGVISVLLPWIVDETGSRLGISQPDGLLALIMGVGALILAWRRVAFGWIVSGFLALLLGRDLALVLGAPSARPGFGLWLGTAAFATAALIQLTQMIRARLTANSVDPVD